VVGISNQVTALLSNLLMVCLLCGWNKYSRRIGEGS